MAEKIFVPQVDLLLTDIIEGDKTECISSKSFAASEKDADKEDDEFTLKSNPKIIYDLRTQDDWAQDITIETIRDDNDSTNTYRKIHVTNIPMNDDDNCQDRSLIFDILYETGITKRKIQYEIFQKALIYNVYMEKCKYDIIIYNSCSFIKLSLYADADGSNMNKCYRYPVAPTIPTNEKDITNEPDYAIIKSNLKTYDKNLTFKFGNKTVNIPVNNEDYYYIDFNLTDYKSNIVSTNPPVHLQGTRYNLYFKFNNSGNILKSWGIFNWNLVNLKIIIPNTGNIVQGWTIESNNTEGKIYIKAKYLNLSDNFLLSTYNSNNSSFKKTDLYNFYKILNDNGIITNIPEDYDIIKLYVRTKLFVITSKQNGGLNISKENDVKLLLKYKLTDDDEQNKKLSSNFQNEDLIEIEGENANIFNVYTGAISSYQNNVYFHLFTYYDQSRDNISDWDFKESKINTNDSFNKNFSINSYQPIHYDIHTNTNNTYTG